MTVSRVLSGRGVVSGRTRQKVEQAVAELGYLPNRLAGSLADSRSNQVGVVLPSITVGIFPEVAAGITQELEKAGYNPVIGITDYDSEREESLVESMLSWNAAGMIVNDFVHTERTHKLLSSTTIPVVEIMAITGEPIDICVGFDHMDAGKTLVEHLIARGYSKFGFLGWHGTKFAASARVQGIRSVLTAANLELFAPQWYSAPPGIADGASGLRKLRQERPDIDVVVFGNDMMATGALLASIEEGWSVPGDIALAGFGGSEIGQALPRPLTTIEFPRFEVGRLSARTVLNAMVGQEVSKSRTLKYRLIEGKTA